MPKRSAKKPKPTRHGFVYLARDSSGAWLLQRRPDKGLLGGMLGWPTGDWGQTPPVECPPFDAEWATLPGEVRHTFTHFHLILRIMTATCPDGFVPQAGFLVAKRDFRPSDLPTVMRKAYDLARG
ncbi:MAG: hypothetical protein COC12_11490 [Rhodobacteraceae bacterium]|nr:MAG: hypothetical protein COC12_11490 [Paracoccaceae bacterium]